ncbi:MAG: hypothetical protein AAFP76_05915 [Bacteroidota bacterium]
MLKNISNLGKALNKAEQQSINGGMSGTCYRRFICPGTGQNGEPCVAQPGGVTVWGTMNNGLCCVS